MPALDFVNTVMQWIVAPVAAFVWLNYMQLQQHKTDIAVLKANALNLQNAHDREMKEIRETMRAMMVKLDSIEEALRK